MLEPVIGKVLQVAGGEFSVGGLGGAGGVGGGAATGTGAAGGQVGGKSFGNALTKAIDNLNGTMNDASTASQQLATGQASDVSSVVMAVERAQLELQLASQVRNKAVESYQEIFRMNV